MLVNWTVNDSVSLLFPAASEDMGTTVNGDVFQVSKDETVPGSAPLVSTGGHLVLTVCCLDHFLVMLGREPLKAGADELLRLSSGKSGMGQRKSELCPSRRFWWEAGLTEYFRWALPLGDYIQNFSERVPRVSAA